MCFPQAVVLIMDVVEMIYRVTALEESLGVEASL